MKKKLLILPITFIVTLLGACESFTVYKTKEESPIYINQWLESVKDPSTDPNPGEFYYVENGTSYTAIDDYELKVRDIIKNGVNNTPGGKIKAEEVHKGDMDYVGYFIRSYIDRFTYCNIRVFDDGDIVTEAGGSGWGAPSNQYYLYSVGTTVTSEIISKTKERYVELDNAFFERYETIREEASLDNFFKHCEEAESSPYVTCKDENWSDRVFFDDDGSILAELEELEYQHKDMDAIEISPIFRYYVNDDWKLNIYKGGNIANYDVASIEYKSNGAYASYYQPTYTFYYSINQGKAEALINRIMKN